MSELVITSPTKPEPHRATASAPLPHVATIMYVLVCLRGVSAYRHFPRQGRVPVCVVVSGSASVGGAAHRTGFASVGHLPIPVICVTHTPTAIKRCACISSREPRVTGPSQQAGGAGAQLSAACYMLLWPQ